MFGSLGNLVTAVQTLKAWAVTNNIEDMKVEAFASSLILPLFLYKDVKIGLTKFGFTAVSPNSIGPFDTNSVTRYINDEGRKNFIVIEEVARIMLNLFPPIPQEKQGDPLQPITKIYMHIIEGLECISQKFFSDQERDTTTPDPKTFGESPKYKKYSQITNEMAGDAISQTINVFQRCLKIKLEPKKELTPIETSLKNSYTPDTIHCMALLLDQIKSNHKKASDGTMLSESFCKSLEMFIEGRNTIYKNLLTNITTLNPRGTIPEMVSQPIHIAPSANTVNENFSWEVITRSQSPENTSQVPQQLSASPSVSAMSGSQAKELPTIVEEGEKY